MIHKIKAFIKEHDMIKEKERVVVGISGGADSVCLLFVLLELQKEYDFEIEAVHVHHGLRGNQADEDEEFVKCLCQKYQIHLHMFHENVKALAEQWSMSEEEAGREIRRKRFAEVFQKQKADKIALAHHQNDNVETVVWNLCRGSSIRGLGGILPKDGCWVRPLLCVDRQMIEQYLEKIDQPYCIDETNLSNEYTRNKIRNELLPYMEENINKQSIRHIQEASIKLRKIACFLEEETKKCMLKCCYQQGEEGCVVDKEALESVPELLRSEVLLQSMYEVCGHKKDIEAKHVDALLDLCNKQVGREVHLPYKMLAKRIYKGIKIYQEKEKGEEKTIFPKYRMRVFEKTEEIQTFPENTYTKWFDYDIIKSAVDIRMRKPGDYIVINHQGKRQKLKQYFINEKIPQEKRDKIWLVADGDQIMWIVGYRQNQAYQVTKETKRILEVQFYGGERNGREN